MKYKYIGNETMRTTINEEELLINYGYEFDSDIKLNDDSFELVVEDNKKSKKKFEEEEK